MPRAWHAKPYRQQQDPTCPRSVETSLPAYPSSKDFSGRFRMFRVRVSPGRGVDVSWAKLRHVWCMDLRVQT